MTEIRSYRSVFDLERRIYRIDRLRLNPGGIPLRGVVYCLTILALLACSARVPLLGALVRALPWYVRELVLPVASAALLALIRIEGRPFHLAAAALARHAVGPRHLSGLRRCAAPGRRWRPDELLVLPDGSDARLRRLRYIGPGAVRRPVSGQVLVLSAARACCRVSAAMRPPLSLVYGNCVFGADLDDGWAAFAVPTASYDWLAEDGKRARFLALLGALEAIGADLQIVRVGHGWDVERYGREMDPDHMGDGDHVEARRRYVAAQVERLHELGAQRPALFILVSLREPERDVASYVSRAVERHPREWLGELRRALAPRDRRLLKARELERARVRADQAHARLADYLEARPASGAELQWLVRRAFCRGLGEPAIDGLHEPRALVFERNGEALLAPLEGDVLRWMEGWVEHRGRALRIESELGVSWQAQLVLGALPERADFPGPRVELMFAPPESLPFGVDLSLNARFLPNDLALRIARRRIQDADQILRAESDGEQGATDLGYRRTQEARDLLAYLQSASRPPLLRATLAVAIGARGEEELEERVEMCRRAYGEIRLHRPLGDQLQLSVSTSRDSARA